MIATSALRSVLPRLGASLSIHAALGHWARAFGSVQGAQQPRPQPRFALAFSDNPSLSLAITECVDQVQRSLGPGVQPDFLQLLVSTDLHLRQMALAPAVSEAGWLLCWPPGRWRLPAEPRSQLDC